MDGARVEVDFDEARHLYCRPVRTATHVESAHVGEAAGERDGRADVHSEYAWNGYTVHLGATGGQLSVALELEDFREATLLARMLVCS